MPVLPVQLFPGRAPVRKLLETLQEWLASLPLDRVPYDAVLDLANNRMRVSPAPLPAHGEGGDWARAPCPPRRARGSHRRCLRVPSVPAPCLWRCRPLGSRQMGGEGPGGWLGAALVQVMCYVSF